MDTAAQDGELVDAAVHAMDLAYSPYSRFPVGCAVRDDKGRIHLGVNVENAAYPVGNCAEASAIAAMIVADGGRIAAIAVAGMGDGLTTPCGACRQRIREFGSESTPVLVCGPEGLRRSFTLGELLPHSFGPDNLSKI